MSQTDSAIPPLTADAAPRPRTSSWWGVAAVALLFAVVALAILVLWLQIAPPAPVEKFLPLASGASYVYRLTKPDGSVSYRARNVQRMPANQLATTIDAKMVDAFLRAANLDLLQVEPSQALRVLAALDAAVIRDIEYDAQGRLLNQVTTLAMVHPERIELFGVNHVPINPPLPLLDLRAPTQTFTGTLDAQLPYTFSTAHEPLDRITTAIGELRDCVRVQSRLELNQNATTWQTTYCANVGAVLDETTTAGAQGAERAEIVAANVGNFIKASAPFPITGGPNIELTHVFSESIGTALEATARHKEGAASNGITTQIVPAGDLLLFGTARGALVALDRATATEQWRFHTGSGIYSTPIVADGIVYFGSADKKVYAVRLADGAFVWAFRTNDLISAAPAAGDGTIYTASEDKRLYALDADTGILRWTFATGSPIVAAPVVSGGSVFVSNANGALYALDARTGSQRWNFAAEKTITAPVTLTGDTVLVATYDGTVSAVRRDDGELVWQSNLNGTVVGQPVAAHGRVYVTLTNEMIALDAANGARVWRHRDPQRNFKGTPLLLGELLWQLTSEDLIALDANDGSIRAHIETADASSNAGVSSDGRALYAGFFDGTLLVWERTGE